MATKKKYEILFLPWSVLGIKRTTSKYASKDLITSPQHHNCAVDEKTLEFWFKDLLWLSLLQHFWAIKRMLHTRKAYEKGCGVVRDNGQKKKCSQNNLWSYKDINQHAGSTWQWCFTDVFDSLESGRRNVMSKQAKFPLSIKMQSDSNYEISLCNVDRLLCATMQPWQKTQ